MKKLGIVLGVAAVATVTGCKDPDYVNRRLPAPQEEVKSVETAPVQEEAPETVVEPVQEEEPAEVTVEEKACTCAPGTKHETPCECGAADCQCVVEVKPAEPEYTIYIVQRDDTLSKISKKFNIKMSAIYALNPSIKGEGMRIRNMFVTYLLGPIFIINPIFTKYYLKHLGFEGATPAYEEAALASYNKRVREFRDPNRGFTY